MRSEKFIFKNDQGLELSGKLDLPLSGKPKAWVLFAHCFTCSKNLHAVDNIARSITQQGMAVLRFDFTGLGQSLGDFSDTNFSTNLSDLRSAYNFLENEYEAPQVLLGHSLGGAAVIHAANDMPKVRAVATIGAPSNPIHVRHLISSNEQEILDKGMATVNIGGRPFQIKKQFIDDLEKNETKTVIQNLNRALLIMHSPQDTVVGIENAAEIYTLARHPKSFITLDGSDHLLSNQKDSEYTGLMVANWALKYIELHDFKEMASEGEVWTRTGDKGFLTEITAGRHHLLADEPASVGGNDFGPSPYGYLLSALGTCTAMTLRMYADFKKIPLEEVQVRLTHDKVHIKDSQASEESRSQIDQMKREILIKGDKLTPEQRKRLIEIADKCPVHKTLESKPQIITQEIGSM
jgi:putative redox protein